jgi:hypothetical protein
MREGGRCLRPDVRREGLSDGAPGGAAPLRHWGARASGQDSQPCPRKNGARAARSQGLSHMGSRKPLAPPGAPFPFQGHGKRDTGLPGAVNNAGDDMRLVGIRFIL